MNSHVSGRFVADTISIGGTFAIELVEEPCSDTGGNRDGAASLPNDVWKNRLSACYHGVLGPVFQSRNPLSRIFEKRRKMDHFSKCGPETIVTGSVGSNGRTAGGHEGIVTDGDSFPLKCRYSRALAIFKKS